MLEPAIDHSDALKQLGEQRVEVGQFISGESSGRAAGCKVAGDALDLAEDDGRGLGHCLLVLQPLAGSNRFG